MGRQILRLAGELSIGTGEEEILREEGLQGVDVGLELRRPQTGLINVLSADVVVVCGGGGPGTASEAAHALNAGRPLILLEVPALWHDFFCSLAKGVESASDVQECCRLIEARLTQA